MDVAFACIKCLVVKPSDQFNKSFLARRNYKCKICAREYCKAHYRKDKSRYIARAAKQNAVAKAAIMSVVNGIKSDPCMDCGRCYPSCVMEFHHRDPAQKISCVSKMALSLAPIGRVLLEIGKCDLLCANCHRIRTYSNKHQPA